MPVSSSHGTSDLYLGTSCKAGGNRVLQLACGNGAIIDDLEEDQVHLFLSTNSVHREKVGRSWNMLLYPSGIYVLFVFMRCWYLPGTLYHTSHVSPSDT